MCFKTIIKLRNYTKTKLKRDEKLQRNKKENYKRKKTSLVFVRSTKPSLMRSHNLLKTDSSPPWCSEKTMSTFVS